MGGDSSHPLVVAINDGLNAVGVTAVRPDFRDPDPAVSAGALEMLAAELGADQVVLIGYSWGSVVASLAAPANLVARVLVAPPVSMLAPGAADGIPALVLVPAHDQYGGPDAVRASMGEWPATTIEVVEGADHFLAGAMGKIADRAVAWVVSADK
jgi:pimeloyl-ACP methyl ester carboxylesterase